MNIGAGSIRRASCSFSLGSNSSAGDGLVKCQKQECKLGINEKVHTPEVINFREDILEIGEKDYKTEHPAGTNSSLNAQLAWMNPENGPSHFGTEFRPIWGIHHHFQLFQRILGWDKCNPQNLSSQRKFAEIKMSIKRSHNPLLAYNTTVIRSGKNLRQIRFRTTVIEGNHFAAPDLIQDHSQDWMPALRSNAPTRLCLDPDGWLVRLRVRSRPRNQRKLGCSDKEWLVIVRGSRRSQCERSEPEETCTHLTGAF